MIRYKNPDKTAVGLLLAALTIFIWGITFVNTKALLQDFSALEILFIRFVLGYLGLLLLAPRKIRVKRRRDELLFAGAGIFSATIYQFLENIAISYTRASNVSIIVSTAPIFTALTAQLFFKEKHITVRFFIGFIVAVFGIALVSLNGYSSLELKPKGDLIALAAAVSWGFYSLFMSKINMLGYESLPATRRMFFYALLSLLPFIAAGAFSPGLRGNGLLSVTCSAAVNAARFSKPMNWINLLFLGFGASAFCFAAWSIVCRFLGTVHATTGVYLIPVVTIVFAFLFLHESVSFKGATGAIITICGLFISEWHHSRPGKSTCVN
jgi:drug/metabolite transporter (DMT)-like permease